MTNEMSKLDVVEHRAGMDKAKIGKISDVSRRIIMLSVAELGSEVDAMQAIITAGYVFSRAWGINRADFDEIINILERSHDEGSRTAMMEDTGIDPGTPPHQDTGGRKK